MDLIKPFDPWRSRLCSCRPKYSLSAYTGCSHNCLYCYSSSYIPNFFQPRIKKNFIKKLEKETKKIPSGSTIAISNSSDPYQPIEKKFRLTRQSLNILNKFNFKINLITKSDLILEDLNLLKKTRKVLVSISITSLDDYLAKKLEPNCPPPSKRIKVIKKLSEFIPVAVRFDPLIYPINTEKIEKFIQEMKKAGAKQIITSTYKLKPDNFQRMIKIFPQYLNLWQNIYYQEGARKNNYVYLKKCQRENLIKKVKQESLKVNLEFSSCRENLRNLNTASCDAISLTD